MTQLKDVAIHDGNDQCLAIRRGVQPSQVGEWIYKLLAESGLMNTTPETLYQVNVVDHEPDEDDDHLYRVRMGWQELIYVQRDVWVRAGTPEAAKKAVLEEQNWVDIGDEDLCQEVIEGQIDMKIADEPVLDE